MKEKMFFILVISIFTQILNGQNRIIHGRVIGQDFIPIPTVKIQSVDTLLLAETDFEGYFSVTIPIEQNKLLLYFFGIEEITIQLPNNCDNLEIIALNQATYDFMSSRKVDKLRLKQFEKLPELHKTAFQKGLFVNDKPCYRREFEAIKPRLDIINKRRRTTSP